MSTLENNLPPPETLCSVCKNQCIFESVKCQKCKQLVHTDCTRLPVYAIVNLFNTRCQYTCEECVRTQLSEAADHQFALVYALIEKEKEAKQFNKVGNDNANENVATEQEQEIDSQPEISNYGFETGGLTRTTINNENHDSEIRKKKVCYFYKNNRCKFGRKGQGCPYAHPGLCNKYKLHGRDPVKGCIKEKCPYFHPPICFGAEKKRECLNLKCKRLHLKGTRRYPPGEPTTYSQRQVDDPPPAPQPQTHVNASHGSNARQSDNQAVTFLMHQVQQIQQMQHQIMQMMKVVPWQWGPHPPLQRPLHQMGQAQTPTAPTYL